MKTKRNSSIELLRIIAMLLIIAQHYVYHADYDRSIFDAVSANVIYLKILSMFGYSACTFFGLISGYHLIRKNTGKSFYGKLVPLTLETTFYATVIMIIVSATGLVSLSLRDMIKQILAVFYGNWYVVFYIVLYLFVPYINPFLKSMDKGSFRKLLLLIVVLFIAIQTFLGEIYDLNNIDFMFLSYVFGAYVQLYPEDFAYKNSRNLLVGLGSALLIIASVIVIDFIGLKTGNAKFIQNDTFLIRWDSLPQFAFSLFIFLYTVKKEFHNPLIDLFGSGVLGIYLIHDGLLRNLIWNTIWPNAQYVDSPYIHSLLKITAVFVICALIDILRQIFLERPLMKALKRTKLYDRF